MNPLVKTRCFLRRLTNWLSKKARIGEEITYTVYDEFDSMPDFEPIAEKLLGSNIISMTKDEKVVLLSTKRKDVSELALPTEGSQK